MPELQKITSYDSEINPLILEQYKNKPLLNAIISIFNARADMLETAIFEIRLGFYIDNAEGVQLDRIGEIFGAYRVLAQSDADYRIAIKATSAQRLSGTPNEIIGVIQSVFGATLSSINLIPIYPASISVLADVSVNFETLKRYLPAGVGIAQSQNLVDGQTRQIQGYKAGILEDITALKVI